MNPNSINLHSIAADIAIRVPEMARDSRSNNAETIEGLIKPLWNAYVNAQIELYYLRNKQLHAQ